VTDHFLRSRLSSSISVSHAMLLNYSISANMIASHLTYNSTLRRSYGLLSIPFLIARTLMIADIATAHSLPKRPSSGVRTIRLLTRTRSDTNASTACSLPSMLFKSTSSTCLPTRPLSDANTAISRSLPTLKAFHQPNRSPVHKL
jgi:hypothetical protein